MTLRLYDTLTKQKQTLEDLPGFDRNNVRMYVCGPTVYDYAHIGNARPVIVFDVLFRLLRHLYGAEHVTYVRNITDIDDKINARAAEVAAAKGVTVEAARVEITNATTKQYLDDVTALGCLVLPEKYTPRATEYVPQMIAMIEKLVAGGHAYPAEGHVLFDVSSKSDYGKLARRSLDEMIAGARVDVAPYKKNPMDFVLWKPSDDATPGWPSPWGRGRPGWHIECSAMGEALLGETFDVHGGGIDLMFPHHENEIAQSESAHHGHPLARLWMHNGFLQVESEKMSKSLGNFVTIRDLLKDWDGEALRLNMLMTHYRQPINWTQDRVVHAIRTLDQWYDLVGDIEVSERTQSVAFVNYRIERSLCDDLNTHLLLGRLHEMADILSRKKAVSSGKILDFELAEFKAAANFLGLLTRTESAWDAGKMRMTNEAAIVAAIVARKAARNAKNFGESDRIRDELLAQGIVLKDNADGTTTWEVKR